MHSDKPMMAVSL